MKVFNRVLTDELNEILSLKAKISFQENKYAALLEADQPLEILKEIRLEIKRLKDKVLMLENHALSLFN
jgi:hypothetical protein